MKTMGKKTCVVALVCVSILLGAMPLKAKIIPKITNFIILVDQSGSMFEPHAKRGETKATLVKKVLLAVNERIPPMGYNGAIQVFSPDKTLIGPEEFNRAFFRKTIQGLADTGEVYKSLTPLGPAILHLDKVLMTLSGKTAVILVSDGRANRGMNPVEAAEQILDDYPDLCFHVISVADNDKGKANLIAISDMNECVFVKAGDLLADPSLVEEFVGEVFFLEFEEIEPVTVTPATEDRPEVITLRGALFDFDRYDLKEEWLSALDESAKKLGEHRNVRIVIEGHTDSAGPGTYNQKLSERRARAIYDYLISKGISADQLKTVGYGETRPAISNLTREGRAMNRRVELIVQD